jgi:hypothetical protein
VGEHMQKQVEEDAREAVLVVVVVVLLLLWVRGVVEAVAREMLCMWEVCVISSGGV